MVTVTVDYKWRLLLLCIWNLLWSWE